MRDVLGNRLKDQLFHLVHWLSITLSLRRRIHQFGKKVFPVLFLGCALYAGRIWKGDMLVADIEELETMDASEIYSKRLNAKEVIFPKENRNFIFPVADGRIKLPGGDQDLRTSTLIRHRPFRGGSHVDFLGESEGSFPPPHDSFPDAGEAINDFWSMSGNFIYRHHVEPRVKLCSPREESFSIPMKYIDVSRTTHTNLDVKQERRIDDCWNLDGSRDLSDYWTGFTQFTLLEEKPPDGYMWSGWRMTRKQLTYRPELWTKLGRNAQQKERQKWSHEKPQLDNARKLRGIYVIDPGTRDSKRPSRMLARNGKHQWLPLCLPRQARTVSMVRPVVNPVRSNQNLRVFWKPVNPQDCVWENLHRIIMKTILQERRVIHCSITIWFSNFSYASSHEDSRSKGSSG